MDIISFLHEPALHLVEQVEAQDITRPRPLLCDSFIARSVLQKAIRRGDCELSLRAASTLMTQNSAVIWRRLLVTALEDLGIHEFTLLVKIAAAVERRKFGHRSADEWALIAQLIRDCCSGTRCQAANDLHNIAISAVEYDSQKYALAELGWDGLVSVAADSSTHLVHRYIAILTAMGASHAPWIHHSRLGSMEMLLAAIAPNIRSEVRAVYGWAFRKSGLALAPGSLLITSAIGGLGVSPPTSDDVLPLTNWAHDVPCFALDQYTRVGRLAIKDLTNQSATWRAFAEANCIFPAQQLSAAGELIFRLERAAVSRRSSWGLARDLAEQSRLIGCHLPPELVEEGSAIILSELPQLDEARKRRMAYARDL